MPSCTLKNIVKMSAAGSGKTWDICHSALEEVNNNNKKALIVTYTNRSAESVRNEIRKQNGGVLHPQIVIKTWFRFLLSETIRPYQTYITGGRINHIKSIDFSEMYGQKNFYKSGNYYRYITTGRNVRVNQVSELALLLNKNSRGKTIKRLEEIYSNIYFDEIQDLAGNDIELLELLFDSSIIITCCGDNKQATFSTHVARKNKRKTGINIWEFFFELEKSGRVFVERNLASRRFNWDICSFANKVFSSGESISTIMRMTTGHDGVYLIDESDADCYFQCYSPKVLRFDARTKVDKPSVNFGECKGETFERVMIYPNEPLNQFILKGKALLSPEKYYVGVTRAQYSIAFVMKKLPSQLTGYEPVNVSVGNKEIKALKYICSEH